MVRNVRDWLKSPQNLIFIAALSLISLLFLSVIFINATSSSSYCNTCHETRADVESWKASTHAQVSCVTCHRERGLGHFLTARFSFPFQETYRHFFEKDKDLINADGELAKKIPAANCRACHSIEKRKITPSPGVIINHEKHAQKDIPCAVCHNRVAHPDMAKYAEIPEALKKQAKSTKAIRVTAKTLEGGTAPKEYYADNLKMVACMRCHNGKTAPDKCETCHTRDFNLRPGNHLAAGWLPKNHADLAEKGAQYCASCHKASYCYSCHKMEMPHPKTDWTKGKKEHVVLGRSNPMVCQTCHTGQYFCDSCHHKGWEPSKGTWIALHQFTVKDKGATPCFTCHNPTFCSYCHVRIIRP